MITEKQKKILEVISSFMQINGFAPTVRELADLMSIKSTSTMQGYLDRLQYHGYISKNAASPRTIKILKIE